MGGVDVGASALIGLDSIAQLMLKQFRANTYFLTQVLYVHYYLFGIPFSHLQLNRLELFSLYGKIQSSVQVGDFLSILIGTVGTDRSFRLTCIR